jgi:hypothetical protein
MTPERRLRVQPEPGGLASAPSSGPMSPDDRFLLRVGRCDGLSRCRPESFRDALRADVVGRDQRDQQVDGSGLVCPVTDGCGCFGRISEAPVRPYQGPAEFGLSMPSRACPSRGRPAARVEDHQARLADHPTVSSGLENERTESVGSPTVHPSFDHGSGLVKLGNGFSVQTVHDHRIREQLVHALRISGSWRAQAEPVGAEADLLPGRDVMSHAGDRSRSLSPQLGCLHAQLGERAYARIGWSASTRVALGPSCNRAGVTGGGQRECDRRFANRSLKAQTSPDQTTTDGAFMEPCGCNRWQPVANRTASKPADIRENRCRRLRPVA